MNSVSQVWVLLWSDYEEVELLGVYGAQAPAEQAQQTLWQRYQSLTDEERELQGPVGLRLEDACTWETFCRWHPLVPFELDGMPVTYAPSGQSAGAPFGA